MSEKANCPHCGAEKWPTNRAFKCGSYEADQRSNNCYEREIAKLKAGKETLRDWIKTRCDDDYECSFGILGDICDGCRCEKSVKGAL